MRKISTFMQSSRSHSTGLAGGVCPAPGASTGLPRNLQNRQSISRVISRLVMLLYRQQSFGLSQLLRESSETNNTTLSIPSPTFAGSHGRPLSEKRRRQV